MRIGGPAERTKYGRQVGCEPRREDVFTWSHDDLLGMDSNVAYHKLTINKEVKPVRQKKRCFNHERYNAINSEVEKLLKVGSIREVIYHEWISNVVLVNKANSKWRKCVDFTDLNKPYHKDNFPLPKID